MQDFRKLTVWEKAHQLVLRLYRATDAFGERRYPGLTSQMRRAAASIPTYIAEGCGHSGQREFARFLSIALASAFELHYHLRLAVDLELLSHTEFARLDARTEEVKRMLTGLALRVRRDTDRTESRMARPKRGRTPTRPPHPQPTTDG